MRATRQSVTPSTVASPSLSNAPLAHPPASSEINPSNPVYLSPTLLLSLNIFSPPQSPPPFPKSYVAESSIPSPVQQHFSPSLASIMKAKKAAKEKKYRSSEKGKASLAKTGQRDKLKMNLKKEVGGAASQLKNLRDKNADAEEIQKAEEDLARKEKNLSIFAAWRDKFYRGKAVEGLPSNSLMLKRALDERRVLRKAQKAVAMQTIKEAGLEQEEAIKDILDDYILGDFKPDPACQQ